MYNLIESIICEIAHSKLNLSDEKILQSEIYTILVNNFSKDCKVFAEKRLSNKDIIDFVLERNNGEKIGIEVKIKGSPKNIYRQLARYSEHNLDSIILLTNKAMGLPNKINNSELFYFNLGRSWL